MGTTGNPAGSAERRTTRWWRWQDAGGLAAPLVALALWGAVIALVASPLGAALSRIDRGRAPASRVLARAPSPPPPRALASAARATDPAPCR